MASMGVLPYCPPVALTENEPLGVFGPISAAHPAAVRA